MFRRLIGIAVALLVIVGCGKGERASAVGLVKDVAKSVRPKEQVKVSIHTGHEEPGEKDQALLRSIEAAIEKENVGRLLTSGFEPGYLFVTVEVENTADAITRLRAILLKAGMLKESSFKVIAAE